MFIISYLWGQSLVQAQIEIIFRNPVVGNVVLHVHVCEILFFDDEVDFIFQVRS